MSIYSYLEKDISAQMTINELRNIMNCVAFQTSNFHVCGFISETKGIVAFFHKKALFIFKKTALHAKILQLK